MTYPQEYLFYAVELRTGEIVVDLPLSSFTGEVSLTGGGMSAELPLLDLDVPLRQQMLDSTIPGRYSIVALRNGVVAGEWIIWQRSRNDDTAPVDLSGEEIISFLDQRVMAARTYSQIEQFTIASELITLGFGASPHGNGAVAMSIAPFSPTGKKRDREYKMVDGTIGGRLKELSEVIDGFDYYVTSTWTGNAGEKAKITRQVNLLYPRAGSDQDIVFEVAASGFGLGGGSIVNFTLVEDGRELASRAYSVGQNVIGSFEDDSLITLYAYPFLEKSQSNTTVTEQGTVDEYAKALWTESQRNALPGKLDILADAEPGYGSFQLGDVVTVLIEESVNFPIGARVDVRVLGWSLKAPASGPEVMSLTVSQEGPLRDYSGNPVAHW